MKKLVISLSILITSTAFCEERLYVEKNNVEELNDEYVVKSLLPLEIVCVLKEDKKGFYITENDYRSMQKGRYSYHYCNMCNQEFFTYNSFKNHVCRSNYYDNGGRSLFSKNPR